MGDPLIHQMKMIEDIKCHAPWRDAMPTDVPDYLCAKLIYLKPDLPRSCYGDSGTGLEQRIETRDINNTIIETAYLVIFFLI